MPGWSFVPCVLRCAPMAAGLLPAQASARISLVLLPTDLLPLTQVLFAKYDLDMSGKLDMTELTALLGSFMPGLSGIEIRFCQVSQRQRRVAVAAGLRAPQAAGPAPFP